MKNLILVFVAIFAIAFAATPAFAQRRSQQCNVQSSSASSSVSTAQVLQQQALLQAQLQAQAAASQPRTSTATATVTNGVPLNARALAVTPPAPVGVAIAPVQASNVQLVPVAVVAQRNHPLQNLFTPKRTVTRATTTTNRRGVTTSTAVSRG